MAAPRRPDGRRVDGQDDARADLAARWETTWAAEAAREVALSRRTPRGRRRDRDRVGAREARGRGGARRRAGGPPARVLRPGPALDGRLRPALLRSCPPWIERLAAERRGDLYLLCAPDLPWDPTACATARRPARTSTRSSSRRSTPPAPASSTCRAPGPRARPAPSRPCRSSRREAVGYSARSAFLTAASSRSFSGPTSG